MPIYKQDGKKNGLQKYRVVVSFTNQNGEYKQLTGTAYGKEEAKQLEIELQTQTTENISKKLTVNELIEKYLESQKGDIRQTTFDKNFRNYKLYVSPQLGPKKLGKITPAVLQEWKNTLNETELSTRTKNNAYRQLSALLNFAVRMGYISKNPLPNVGPFRDPDFVVAAEHIRYYTADQFLKFIAAAKTAAEKSADWRYYVFFNIAFYTGLRKGEINALNWNDIDGNVLHVRHSISQKIKGDDVETPPKNPSSYRSLIVPAPLLAILNEHKHRQKSLANFSESFKICGGEKALRDTSIAKKNDAYAKAAELPHITIHEFRHSHASLLINEGISIQEIARRLGHSDVQITWKTYAHLYPREEERAVKILNAITL